jgi:Ca2+-binding EF-hand superfamily protein
MIRCLWMLGMTTALVLATAVSGADGDAAKKAKGGKDTDALFKKIDANGDGKISKEEFRKFFADMAAKVGKLKDNPDMAEQIADKIFDKLDANGDGFLSKEEFQKFAEMRNSLGGGKGNLDPEKLKDLKDKLQNGNFDPEKVKEILDKLKADGKLDPEKLKEQLKKLKDKE